MFFKKINGSLKSMAVLAVIFTCGLMTSCTTDPLAGSDSGAGTGSSTGGSSTVESLCENGLDDDQDGSVDCEDTDCSGSETCAGVSSTETNCSDRSDNDRDGLLDCDDTDCADNPQCDFSNLLGCYLGSQVGIDCQDDPPAQSDPTTVGFELKFDSNGDPQIVYPLQVGNNCFDGHGGGVLNGGNWDEIRKNEQLPGGICAPAILDPANSSTILQLSFIFESLTSATVVNGTLTQTTISDNCTDEIMTNIVPADCDDIYPPI